MIAQVGIGTTNPQAQLDVTGGNVRFSDYGSGTYLQNEAYILGVNNDGDIVEVETNSSGLQYYTWNTANVSTPDVSNVKNLGVSTSSGLWTSNLDDTARASLAPDSNGYIIRFIGTLKVNNTGLFNFSATSDDGSRSYIDDVLVLENWFQQSPTTRTGNIFLAKGEHKIEFFYYENSGGDFMSFQWGANPDGYTVGSVIDSSQFIIK